MNDAPPPASKVSLAKLSGVFLYTSYAPRCIGGLNFGARAKPASPPLVCRGSADSCFAINPPSARERAAALFRVLLDDSRVVPQCVFREPDHHPEGLIRA